MSGGDQHYTTNEEDQREAAKLKARLAAASQEGSTKTGGSSSNNSNVKAVLPNVSIAEGKHKYVLITAIGEDDRGQHFVVSKAHAAYHRDAAEPFVAALERSGYRSISILGGGRIRFDPAAKSVHIYGFSYGFGKADHALSQRTVEDDPRYEGYTVTWSNDGY